MYRYQEIRNKEIGKSMKEVQIKYYACKRNMKTFWSIYVTNEIGKRDNEQLRRFWRNNC